MATNKDISDIYYREFSNARSKKFQPLLSNEFIRTFIIRNPGKFEGESLATLYFYEGYLNGWADCDYCIPLEKSDYALFGIDSKYSYVQILESDYGFVSLNYLTESQYYQQNEEEEEEEEYSL